jgi:lysophospholipase
VEIFLTTKDNVKIAADIYSVENPKGWLVLAHMMPATKESYNDLAEKLQGLGYESIAIDLRGHGESDAGPNGFAKFSDEEHQKSILDLEAAVEHLATSRKATRDKVVFVGASIGANLSLQYISEHPEFKTAILLSPGLNYRGIETEPLVKKLKAGQKVLFVSAKDDGDNAEENQKLFNLTPAGVEKKIQIYPTGGHGTDILDNQPELKNLIIDFLR